ncbi:MAG: hypothetical protein ACR2P1_09025 [Pseudomonadales bacterium]
MPQQLIRASRIDRSLSLASNAVVVFTCAAAFYWFFWTLLVWYRYHPHLPWRDTFLVLTSVAPLLEPDAALSSLLSLFDLHYSAHRIAVVRVLVMLDVSLLGGQNHLLYAAAWLSMLAMLALYVVLARDYFVAAPAKTIFVAALTIILLFSPAHVWNNINPVNTGWHISLACSMAAFYLLLRQRESLRARDWVLAYAFATLAAFSTFAGVICWLLLPLFALVNQRRVFGPALLFSLVLAVMYSQGMTSDAEVALDWNLGSEEALQQVKAQAQAAISANTPWRILEKTCQLLTWPLVRNHKALAGILAVVSMGVIAGFWLQSLRMLLVNKSRQHVWLELCLLCATLCGLTLIAANMGRIITQPNYIHGPSFERYQTLISVYWISVLGLLVSLTTKLSRQAGLALLIVSIGVVSTLLVPTGTYLKQEIASAEYAARLYMTGERAQLRDPVRNKLVRFTPEYVFSFDDFFSRHQVAYRVPATAPSALPTPLDCNASGISFSLNDVDITGTKSVIVSIGAAQAYTTRELTLFAGGKLVGRLYPEHTGDYSPVALLRRESNQWRGLLETDQMANEPATVLATTIFGSRPLCSLVL